VSELVGTPSDDVPEVLATGRCVVTNIFASMCARHPEGRDAEYLGWHTFDHRPEQYRLQELRGSLRLVSTPDCRAVRATSDTRYDTVDHVMNYFFSDVAGLREFNDLAVALGGAGRIPYLLPLVERGVYSLDGMAAAPRVKIGADVLPWSPLLGAYLLIEEGRPPGTGLVDIPGVAGVWWGTSTPLNLDFATADGNPMSSSEGLQVTYCFLDQDPVATAELLTPVLERRWAGGGVTPLLAAPFYAVGGHDYDRHLP
jgi:hypothetical protein